MDKLDLTDVIDWDDVCFIDCETRSMGDPEAPDASVMTTSTLRYAANSYPIVITWAFGLTGEVHRWATNDIHKPPMRDELPQELLEWGGYFAAWHAAFDREELDATLDAGGIKAWLDMMVQASYNNMPLGLDRAAKASGHKGKVASGKRLIKMFCVPDGDTPESHPEDWAEFLHYADEDIVQMQAFAAATLPVPFRMWQEYWVSEKINRRGLPIDLDMARGGAVLAAAYAEQTNARVNEITDGDLYSVRQYDAQRAWVWERVRGNPFLSEHMVVAHRVTDTGEDEYKLKMDRPRITKLIAALNTLDEKQGLTDDEYKVLCFLEEREFGASAAPAKFAKMLDMVMPDGTVPNQYVFAGATQTTRYSSKGVQVHNMTRSTVGDTDAEEDACMYLIEVGEQRA